MSDADDTLDPWVVQWMADNPLRSGVFDTLDPEILPLARGPHGFPVTREIARVTDGEVAGVPVRFYEHDEPATGVIVYFHGGGFCIGSIGLMDNVARELAHATGAVVISVEYRLAPEHPYPAGLDDCEAVTRWALANTDRFGVDATKVAVPARAPAATSRRRWRCACATPQTHPRPPSPPRSCCTPAPRDGPTTPTCRRVATSTGSC